MGSGESGPQKHQAGPAFVNIVWNTLFPQTSVESILQAGIFRAVLEAPLITGVSAT